MPKPAPSKVKKATAAKPKARPASKAQSPTETAAPAKLDLPPGSLLGAHTSTSGGVSQSVGRAITCGFTAAQIFVKNNKQWFAPPLSDSEAADFRQARKVSGIYFFAHNS